VVFDFYFPTKWGGGAIFNGYFSVNNSTSLIQGFYDLSLPTSSGYMDVLLPTNDAASYLRADNKYPFTDPGTNFYSTALQTFFSIGQNHFNIYFGGNILSLFTSATGGLIVPPYTIITSPISGPPSTLPCFKEGVKILSLNKNLAEEYIPIENLRKGDLIKSFKHGYKAIDMIGKREIFHPASKERVKNQLYECGKENYSDIFEPLIMTGCHSILVDLLTQEQGEKTMEDFGRIFMTDDKIRLMTFLDEKASVYEVPGTYTIYHLALENDDYYGNYGIYANGLLVESCSKRYLLEHSGMEMIE